MAGSKRSTLDLEDALHERIVVARAIFDCAKVLTALERSPQPESSNGEAVTGAGMADGHTMRDDSLPDLLAFGTRLIDQIAADVDQLAKEARHATR